MFSSKLNGINANSFAFFSNFIRSSSTKPTSNAEIIPKAFNRNPRNLERLRIAYKPKGYTLENKTVSFWHKLDVHVSESCVTAKIIHNNGKEVVYASTCEWAFKKYLTSLKNRQAFIVLAKVFADRCLESGINCFSVDIKAENQDTNIYQFLKILKDEGLTLNEPEVFNPTLVWHRTLEKKPWTVLED